MLLKPIFAMLSGTIAATDLNTKAGTQFSLNFCPPGYLKTLSLPIFISTPALPVPGIFIIWYIHSFLIPRVPNFRSQDLVNWESLGHILVIPNNCR